MNFHPVDVSFIGVDLSVMRNVAERLSQFPRRERIGGEPGMNQCNRGNRRLVLEVQEILRHLLGHQLPFVVNGLVPNSGWDSIHTVRSGQSFGSHFYRSDALYSQANGKTYWQWDITSNPFGTSSNQTYIVTIKN